MMPDDDDEETLETLREALTGVMEILHFHGVMLGRVVRVLTMMGIDLSKEGATSDPDKTRH